MEPSKLDQLKIEREPEKPPARVGLWIFVILLLLVLAGGAAWYFRPPPPPEVRVANVQAVSRAAAGTVLNASGYVTARRAATVSSKLTAQVLEVNIEEGMRVEQGQVLARLDDVNVRRSFELAEAQLASAQTQRAETQALLSEANARFERTQSLVERQLASEAEMDSARASAESLAARLKRVEADIKVAERQLDIYRQQLDDTIIRAPFDGVIVAKNAQPGEMISPVSAGGGFTRTGIGTLVDMSSLEIEIDVNEAYINRVRPGQAVVATLDAYPDWSIPCHVIAIIPTADRQRATVEVRVGFDELDPRILPDMGVKVGFKDDQAGAAEDAGPVAVARVPANALTRVGERDIAWVVGGDGVIERRAVATGGRQDDEILVVSGLSGGERVILNAPAGLEDGTQVKVRN
ncbi:efflux RND transporter periplasmic adaptor subunit [Marinihelvus fidelis]|uniref:Efflux RND transporter periplasmic adaptor subunit n=1 Tax=Marinihelvus fidelis TaxID=2613842 RepID=A0A5N0T9J5_9GAMM|nr:efflux RND transporter periplasmic adaptor subunit [Marinihelvus fidelis]KAA9131441.1 efflux RND transporter periplasmic adaptor subunit [Marinihelvus fidelis]